MNNAVSLNRTLLTFAIPLTMLGILVLFLQSSLYSGTDYLNLAITIDLLITVPVVYFLLVRKTDIPNTTVVPITIIGIVVGSLLLPKDGQNYLDMFVTWVLPIIELTVITYIFINLRKAIKKFRTESKTTPDFFTALKTTCYEILPRPVAMPLATEITVVYYGLLRWTEKDPAENEFTYHKKSGALTLFFFIIMMIGIETYVFHILLSLWNEIVAWIFTGLSLYAAMQFIGFASALSKRPIVLEEEKLVLRYGILNETEIPYSEIESISLSRKKQNNNKLFTSLSPLGALESQNVLITLKVEHHLTGLYGFTKKFDSIGLFVDKQDEFVERIMNKL